MSTSPLNVANLTLSVAKFKDQTLGSLFDSTAASSSTNSLAATFDFSSLLDQFSHSLQSPATSTITSNPLMNSTNISDELNTLINPLYRTNSTTPTTPTGLDSVQLFSSLGQNLVTVINRVEVSFKAQFSELSELKNSLMQEQDAAQKLTMLNGQTSNSDIKAMLAIFIESYHAGVNRFGPDVAKGGILEGSQEAARARFATQREINNILIGAEFGIAGGLTALGISTDPQTGLASIDQTTLDTTLAQNKEANIHTVINFATAFSATVANINAPDNPQDRQLKNLDKAIHWIKDNKSAVEMEFGPGAAATPNQTFARAAAQYDQMAKVLVR